jgi:hypothetical protein
VRQAARRDGPPLWVQTGGALAVQKPTRRAAGLPTKSVFRPHPNIQAVQSQVIN